MSHGRNPTRVQTVRRLALGCAVAFGLWPQMAAAARPDAAPPDWVPSGNSVLFPWSRFVCGFSMAEIAGGGAQEALSRASNDAMADVATEIKVDIRHSLTSLEVSGGGRQEADVSAVTQSLSDERLMGIRFERWSEPGRVYVLAVLERDAAAKEHARKRDQLIAEAQDRIAAAEKSETGALDGYLAARVALLDAEGEDSLVHAISPDAPPPAVDPDHLRRNIEGMIDTLLHGPAVTLADAVAALAQQLRQQGVTHEAKISAADLTYGATSFSSLFGRAVARDLQVALARADVPGAPPAAAVAPLVLAGSYQDTGDDVRITLFAREAASGRAVASAETALPKRAIDASLPLRPQNYEAALQDEHLLGQGELVSGDLHVEVWTQKGRGPLVVARGEQVRIYLRVNKPAWVRLTYLLADRTKAVLEQAYYVDESQVNRAVEYPHTFRVTPPFGIEQLYAVAFTAKPEPLPTTHLQIEDGSYEVVADTQILVRHRGFTHEQLGGETAEALLSLTTLPREKAK